MSLIKKFVEIRLYNFLREFDIILAHFDFYSRSDMRKNSWEILKQKLIKQNYATNENDLVDCRVVIKNIIWKNIMSYEIIDDRCHIYMYYNRYFYAWQVFSCNNPYLNYELLVNKDMEYTDELKNNCFILQTKIINYMMLLDILVTENMIYDLVPMFKAYIFNVILVL